MFKSLKVFTKLTAIQILLFFIFQTDLISKVCYNFLALKTFDNLAKYT